MVAPVVIWADLALNVMVRQHRVVQSHAALRGVTLPLVLVVVDAVDVYDAFVVLSRVALYLDYA